MKFSQYVKGMVMLTSLCLIYTHLQVQIFDLAYNAMIKEKKIRTLNEDHGNATYAILRLESAHNIGGKLLAEDSDMMFMDDSQIVRLTAPATVQEEQIILTTVQQRPANPILSLFSLRAQAEAKPQQ